MCPYIGGHKVEHGDRVKFTNLVRGTSKDYNWQVGDEGQIIEVCGAFIMAQKDWPDGAIDCFLTDNLEVIPDLEEPNPESLDEPSLSLEPFHLETSQSSEPPSAAVPALPAEDLQAWEEHFGDGLEAMAAEFVEALADSPRPAHADRAVAHYELGRLPPLRP